MIAKTSDGRIFPVYPLWGHGRQASCDIYHNHHKTWSFAIIPAFEFTKGQHQQLCTTSDANSVGSKIVAHSVAHVKSVTLLRLNFVTRICN